MDRRSRVLKINGFALLALAGCVLLFHLPVDVRRPYTRVRWVGSQVMFGKMTLVAVVAAPVPPGHTPSVVLKERTVTKYGFGPVQVEQAGPWSARSYQ